MNNYPAGAREDVSAPFNQEDPGVSITCDKHSIDVYDAVNSITLYPEDIENYFIEGMDEEDEVMSIEKVGGSFEVYTKLNKCYTIYPDEIISYFYTKH